MTGGNFRTELAAPFPWYGGKRRWAETILERLGDDADSYIEPFAGSLAVLLHKKVPYGREIVCDINGLLVNFWRSIKFDPEQTAHWAQWPTLHLDLTARHKWLVAWGRENVDALREDPEYHDVKAAGWWVWGVSNWIGGGFCSDVPNQDQIPHVSNKSGGTGIQSQRKNVVHDKIPKVNDKSGGTGIQAQRKNVVHDKIPAVQIRGGRGISAQRKISVQEWFDALSVRLYKVVVLNRDWKSGTSPSILGNTSSYRGTPAVFLDPPYLTSDRANLYRSDTDGSSDQTATEAYEWAVEHGSDYRIAYACHAGDFPVPDGWDAETLNFRGIRNDKQAKQDMVMFSPACRPKENAAKKGSLDKFL